MFEIRSSQLRRAAGTASAPAPVRPQARRTSITGSTRSNSSNTGSRRPSQSSILSLNRTGSNLSEQQGWRGGTGMRIDELFKEGNNGWLMTFRPDGVTKLSVPLEKPFCDGWLSFHFTNAYNNWETQPGDLRKVIRNVRLDYEWTKSSKDGRVLVRNIKWPMEKQPKGGASWSDYAGAIAQVPLAIPVAVYAVLHHRSDLQNAFDRP